MMIEPEKITAASLDRWLLNNPDWIACSVSDKAQEWIQDAARRRTEHGESRGWKSKTDKNIIDFHLAGCIGEWMCHHVFGVRFGRVTGNSRKELNGGDLSSGDLKIEVKTSRSPFNNMWGLIENEDKFLAFPENLNRPYVMCLSALYPHAVIVVGWAFGREIFESGRRANHSYTRHPIRILPRNRLKPPLKLHQHLGLKVPEWIGK